MPAALTSPSRDILTTTGGEGLGGMGSSGGCRSVGAPRTRAPGGRLRLSDYYSDQPEHRQRDART